LAAGGDQALAILQGSLHPLLLSSTPLLGDLPHLCTIFELLERGVSSLVKNASQE
jgi:hypothetical protein